jgi:hypothetical protein
MPTEAKPSVDRRALKILFDTHWSGGVWRLRDARCIPAEDFAYAKGAGVMFDEVRLSHRDLVERALSAVRAVDRESVADAFVASLSSRQLELRSALGSFAVLQHFPHHDTHGERGACPVCGAYDRASEPENLNVLNFERLKWGGVRHSQPLYAALDLELFARLKSPVPTRDDVRLLRAILDAIEAAPPDTSSASLEKCLAKVVKSNKPERDVLIGILGMCGILGTAAHPGYLRQFVPASARELPPRRFVDMGYPACWWTRADGVSKEAVAYWFGHLL